MFAGKCEVIELDEPRRLSYTWHDLLMHQLSIVTWTLIPVDGGTRLQLKHQVLQHEAIKLVEPLRSADTRKDQFMYDSKAVTQTLSPITRTAPRPSIPVGNLMVLDNVVLNSFLNGGWDYRLNERLPQVLVISIPDRD